MTIVRATGTRDSAIDLARKGFRVFPLTPGGKTPELSADWKTVATSDHEKVSELWSCPVFGHDQGFNIGIALDPGDVVVDIDVRNGKQGEKSLRMVEMLYDELPPTYTVTTASGGQHRYYRAPPQGWTARLAEDIDIKTGESNGGSGAGYVVAEGSRIGDGYYAGNGRDPAQRAAAPGWLVALGHRKVDRNRVSQAGSLVEEDGEAAIARAKAWLEGSAPESGTYRVACRVKDLGISEEKCVELLEDHWPGAAGKDHDHIAFRVGNAYRYGKNAIGAAAPEAEFEAVEIGQKIGQEKKPRLYFELSHEVSGAQEQPYLIENWFDQGSMVVTYGDSNVGKTNVVMSQAFAIATGQPWAGCRTTQGLVVYVAAEGGRGARKRVLAYRRTLQRDEMPFALVPCSVDLLRPNGDTRGLIGLIKQAEAKTGQRCVMVVLDTLSRVLAGGNENGPEDMGALVKHCDAIREATKAAIHLIHHSGKNTASGARGHSLLRAATDTEIEVTEGMISGTKQRDMEYQKPLDFRLEVVTIGQGSEGKPITSVVANVSQQSEFGPEQLSSAAVEALEDLRSLLAKRAETDRDKRDICSIPVTASEWQIISNSGIQPGQTREAQRKAFVRVIRDPLLQAGQIRMEQAKGKEVLIFLTNPDNPDRPGQT